MYSSLPPLATSVTVADIRLAYDADGGFVSTVSAAGWCGGSQSQESSDNELVHSSIVRI